MAEIIKETTTTQRDNVNPVLDAQVKNEATGFRRLNI